MESPTDRPYLDRHYRHNGVVKSFHTVSAPPARAPKIFWGCAKGTAKALCGETVVQNAKKRRHFSFKRNLEGREREREENGLSKSTLLDDRFPARRLLRSCGALSNATEMYLGKTYLQSPGLWRLLFPGRAWGLILDPDNHSALESLCP